MADDDFACDNFVAQKWRKDVCKNCYQPLKVHQKKDSKPSSPSQSPPTARSITRTLSGGSSTKPSPKVFQRFQVNKKPLIDKTVPAKERTAAPNLEGIQPGTVKRVHRIAPTLKTRDPPVLPGATPAPTTAATNSQDQSNEPDKQEDTKTVIEASPKQASASTQASPKPKPTVKPSIAKPPPPISGRPSGYQVPAKPKPPPQFSPKTTAKPKPVPSIQDPKGVVQKPVESNVLSEKTLKDDVPPPKVDPQGEIKTENTIPSPNKETSNLDPQVDANTINHVVVPAVANVTVDKTERSDVESLQTQEVIGGQEEHTPTLENVEESQATEQRDAESQPKVVEPVIPETTEPTVPEPEHVSTKPAVPEPEPESTEPAVPEPEPESTEPAVPEPEPESIEPAVPEPESTEPAVPEPESTEPTVPEPEPESTEPAVPEPEPESIEPAVPEPESTEPAVPEPESTEPTVPEPEPESTEPAVPEPESTEPAVPEPEPESTEPAVPEPEHVSTKPAVPEPEPESTEPAVPEPEPESIEPAVPEPESTEPAVPEPESTEPTVPEPEPESTEPAVPEPESTEPAVPEPEPESTEPAVPEPEPQTIEPAVPEPESTEPAVPEPESIEPAVPEPESIEPAIPEVTESVVCASSIEVVESSQGDGLPENEDKPPVVPDVPSDSELVSESGTALVSDSENDGLADGREAEVVSPEGVDGGGISRLATKKKKKKDTASGEIAQVQSPNVGEDEVVKSKPQQEDDIPNFVPVDDVPPPPNGAPPPPPSGIPPPPPPPPPPPVAAPPSHPLASIKRPSSADRKASLQTSASASAHEDVMAAIRGGITLKSAPPPESRAPSEVTAQEAVLQAIRAGTTLKSAPPPKPREPGVEKVVDVASELRLKVMKRKKKEAQSISSGLEEHREEVTKLAKVLVQCSGTHSFLHQLKALLHQVDTLLEKINIPPAMLAHRLQWPSHLVDDLREVLDHMRELEEKVVDAENLCKQTLMRSMGGGGNPSGSPSPSWRVNPEAVERCVQNVVRLARNLTTDESRYFRASTSFPVDATDIQGLLMRAADAVSPLMDKLYEKALNAHASISDSTATKYDQSFRLQNAQRLLLLCCNMSDSLAMHLDVARHASYSDAQLKYQQLANDFQGEIQVAERQGEWDTDEQMVLGRKTSLKPASDKQSEYTDLTKQVMSCLTSSGSLSSDLEQALTADVLGRIESSLITASVATCKVQVVDNCVALRNKVYAGDEAALHKNDFLWLLQAVTKGNHECLTHLVKLCGIPVNCRSADNGTSILHRAIQRQDLPTVACLIRLGADPLLKNAFNSSSTDMLALKSFPPRNLSAKLEGKEPLFDLASYINNPSLSDVVLISEDGMRFHGHRLVLCAQSPVFKSMLDSDLWVESSNKEIPLPTINGKVVQILLQYLYTGRCLFPRDDLNLGIELMAAADQFLLDPMKAQCEQVLSQKIDQEVAVPLYYAAFRFSTPILLASTCNYILKHYAKIGDEQNEVLLHILDNAPQK